MNRLLLTTTLVFLPFAALPAFAQCAPDNAPDNGVVTCTGTDTDGFSRNRLNLSVTVEEGASVATTGSTDAIRVRGTGATVTNRGSISNTGSGDNRGDGIDGRINLTVLNYGSINALNKGVDTDGAAGAKITNFLGATIIATDKGIRAADDAQITNHGRIESYADEGIEGGNDVFIINTGTILGFDDAIQVGENATIVNSGLIENNGTDLANPQDAIDIDSGTITNTATGIIRSTLDAAIDFDGSDKTSIITNYGLISGKYGVLVETGEYPDENGVYPDPNTATQIINNYGTIEGTSGLALMLGAGNDIVNLYAGSSLKGGVDLGADDDTLTIFSDLVEATVGSSILSGGEGSDTLTFAAFSLNDLLRAVFKPGFSFFVFANNPDYAVSFNGWESYGFGDKYYSQAQIETALAPVPLPAAGLLMIPALGALAALRRRRKA